MLHLPQISVYRIWQQAPRRRISGKEAAADLMQAVSRCAWLPEDRNYSGFVRKAICYGAPLDTNKTVDFERFCHREGLLVEKYPDGSPASTWFALMPWACGSILEGICGDLWNNWFSSNDV